jgi:hypothetical protein
MGDGQKPIVPVRFPPTMAANARQLAERDGKTLSAWVRHIVEREVARREGICPTCDRTFDTATSHNRQEER